jgi:hypothetical protein
MQIKVGMRVCENGYEIGASDRCRRKVHEIDA